MSNILEIWIERLASNDDLVNLYANAIILLDW